jgi:tRNA(His) guanylyltransferase
MSTNSLVDMLGHMQKSYEDATDYKLPSGLPIIARVDGRSFHNFTALMKKPYDLKLVEMMHGTAKHLLTKFNALTTYTQSDEITLLLPIFRAPDRDAFSRRLQKMCSLIAAEASVYFAVNSQFQQINKYPTFDCRIHSVPHDKVVEYFSWREADAVRNSVNGLAFSIKNKSDDKESLYGKNLSEMQEYCFKVGGRNWNDEPAFFKRGQYFQKRQKKLAVAELESLPPKHDARRIPSFTYYRTVVEAIDCPPINKVTNAFGFLMIGEEPETEGTVVNG